MAKVWMWLLPLVVVFVVRAQLTDLALFRPVTASGVYGTSTADKAVDGDMTTAWGTNQASGAWLKIDLQGAKKVTAVNVLIDQEPACTTTYEVWSYGVADSQKIATFHQYTDSGVWLRRSLSPELSGITGLKILAVQTCSWVSFFEVVVYGYNDSSVSSTRNLALGLPVSSSGFVPNAPDANVNDGDTMTEWVTDQAPGAWIAVDLLGTSTVDTIKAKLDQTPACSTTISLSITSDGVSRVIRNFVGYTRKGDWLVYAFPTPAANVTQVKFTFVRTCSWPAFYEIQVIHRNTSAVVGRPVHPSVSGSIAARDGGCRILVNGIPGEIPSVLTLAGRQVCSSPGSESVLCGGRYLGAGTYLIRAKKTEASTGPAVLQE